MNTIEWAKCHAIIHTASVSAAAVGAGLNPGSCSDSRILAPIQLIMAICLGHVFGIDLDESRAKAALASTDAATAGRATSRILTGCTPLGEKAVNAGTAAAFTEAIGWSLAKQFSCQVIF